MALSLVKFEGRVRQDAEPELHGCIYCVPKNLTSDRART